MAASHRGHASLALLARPVDVEIEKARHLTGRRGEHAPHDIGENADGARRGRLALNDRPATKTAPLPLSQIDIVD